MTNSPKRMKWQKPPKPKPPISYQPPAIKFAGAFGVQTTKTEQSKMDLNFTDYLFFAAIGGAIIAVING